MGHFPNGSICLMGTGRVHILEERSIIKFLLFLLVSIFGSLPTTITIWLIDSYLIFNGEE